MCSLCNFLPTVFKEIRECLNNLTFILSSSLFLQFVMTQFKFVNNEAFYLIVGLNWKAEILHVLLSCESISHCCL
jgi:hypothetical protein